MCQRCWVGPCRLSLATVYELVSHVLNVIEPVHPLVVIPSFPPKVEIVKANPWLDLWGRNIVRFALLTLLQGGCVRVKMKLEKDSPRCIPRIAVKKSQPSTGHATAGIVTLLTSQLLSASVPCLLGIIKEYVPLNKIPHFKPICISQ